MIIPDALITQTPLWWQGSRMPFLAYGPFVVVRGDKKIYGMYLEEYSNTALTFFDGERMRVVGFDSIQAVGDELVFQSDSRLGDGVFRGLDKRDAKDVGLDPKRAGLTKEDVITRALLTFQPRNL